MARSDSFFIRAQVNAGQAATFNQVAVDLGAYVDALGKSVLRIHNIAPSFSDSDGTSATLDAESFDNAPQLWTNGYLVAVDTIYLGGEASAGFAEDVYITLVMECTVETMTQAAAMALALSQQ